MTDYSLLFFMFFLFSITSVILVAGSFQIYALFSLLKFMLNLKKTEAKIASFLIDKKISQLKVEYIDQCLYLCSLNNLYLPLDEQKEFNKKANLSYNFKLEYERDVTTLQAALMVLDVKESELNEYLNNIFIPFRNIIGKNLLDSEINYENGKTTIRFKYGFVFNWADWTNCLMKKSFYSLAALFKRTSLKSA